MKKAERGGGRLGCMVMALLAMIFVYVSYRIIPIYLEKVDFEEDLGRIASKAGANNLPERTVRDQVLQLANLRGFQILPEDIQVERTSALHTVPEIKIEVNYYKPVEFPGYVHTFHFKSHVSSFIGRL